jgi:hypothetical protein
MHRTITIPVAFTTAALCAGALVLSAHPAGAAIPTTGSAAAPQCTSARLTDVPDSSFVDDLAISGDGRTVAFSSPADLGSGGGNREVYLADTSTGAVQALTQVTGSTLDSTDPALDFDASHVAFLSEAPIWQPNADGNAEVLRAERNPNTGVWTFGNLTTGTTGDANRSPVIDADGGSIAYLSRRTDVANADGNLEVWRWEPAGTTQVSETTDTGQVQANADDLSISDDGEQLVWTSRSAHGAGAATNRSRLVYDRSGTNQQIQIAPDGDLDTYHPSAGRTQRELVFQADESLGAGVGGENQDLNQEVWRWTQPFIGPIVTAPLTIQPAQANDTSGQPSSNDRATVVAFESTAPDLTGQNTSVPSVVRWAETGGTTVLAPAWDGVPQPQTSAIGHLIAYLGPDTGPGGDGSNDVFVARCRTFADVSLSQPFWEDVEWAAAELITTGYVDGTYRPSEPVTRAAMAAFMFRLSDPFIGVPDTTPTFTDVGTSHPFFQEVEWLADQGVVGGYPDDTFRPGAPVTRQSMGAFLFRLAGEPDGPFPDPGFSDVGSSHPFREEIAWMAAEGVADGYQDGTFRPGAAVSRQAMSAFLHRFWILQHTS